MSGSLNTWNCLACKRRKVRCDRKQPCGNCVRRGAECVFPTSGRVPRRIERETTTDRARHRGRSQLLGRLRRLEELLERETLPSPSTASSGSRQTATDESVALSLSPDSVLAAAQQLQSSRIRAYNERKRGNVEPEGEDRETTQAQGTFWATIRHEITSLREAFEEDEEDGSLDSDSRYVPEQTPSGKGHSDGPGFAFWRPTEFDAVSVESLHPMPSQMLFIWQTYQDNVDPFVKVLHTPTVTQVLQQCRCQLHELGPSMEALFMSIAYAAIVSLSEEEVRRNFQCDKASLKTKYRVGAERSLTRADLLNTSEIPTVQALIIFLTVLSGEGSARSTWSLAGLLIRLAVSLGLHRDGQSLSSMSPFEAEIRRRMWWNICILDCRADESQLQDYLVNEHMFSTQPPTNLNDADIWPEMAAPATARNGATEMSINLERCEIWQLSRVMRANAIADTPGTDTVRLTYDRRLEAIHDFRNRNLLNRRPPANGDYGKDAFVRTCIAWCANRFESTANYQYALAKNIDPSFSQHSFNIAVEILEQMVMLAHAPSNAKWAWINQGNVQWQALGIVLGHMSKMPWEARFERAWLAVCSSLHGAPETIQQEQMWRPLQALLARAKKRRNDYFLLQNSGAAQTPTESGLVAPGAALMYNTSASPGIADPSQHFFQCYNHLESGGDPGASLATPVPTCSAAFDISSYLPTAGPGATPMPAFESGEAMYPTGADQSWVFADPAFATTNEWPNADDTVDWQEWNRHAQAYEQSAFWRYPRTASGR